MMTITKKKIINLLLIKSIIAFLVIITCAYFYINLNNIGNISNYAFSELFINYQAGFIRRGLLGEIFWQLNDYFLLKPLIFFSYLFLFFYLIQIYLYLKIFKSYENFYFIFIIIFLSPALILFPIYEVKLFFIKDIFVKLSILFHAYLIIKYKKNEELYFKCLKFIIIPILIFTILIHEFQVLFLSVHYLLSISFGKSKKETLKIYSILLVPIFLVFIFIGDVAQVESLKLILEKFEINQIHQQLSGGFYRVIGGFYIWHFYYFSYTDFIELLASIFLSIGVFFLIFHFLIKAKVIEYNNKYQKNYLYFFAPTLSCFLLALDHGRSISLLSVHLVAFYGVLAMNEKKLNNLIDKIDHKFFIKFFLLIFLFFYAFLWRLDQMAGFNLAQEVYTIFQSSVFSEIIKFIKYLYYLTDINIINLPEIKTK